MKILQVNKYYQPDIGGVETVVKQFAENLGEGFDVTVLCVKKNFSLKKDIEIINDVKVIRCASFGTFWSMPVSISFFITFFKLYRNFDILHFHEPFPLASLLSFFIGKRNKIAVTWHSDIIKQKSLKNIVEIFQKNLCKKATIIFTTSPNLLEYSNILKKFRNKVFILPLSIPVNKYVSDIDDNYILYLGRLAYYKGIEVLLNAHEIAKTDLELLIVGSGEKEITDIILEHCHKSSKKIRFINRFVSEEEKEVFLKNCSFFVLPSIAASEAFAIIQLEAMIQGKAVINTNLPTGVPFVSQDGKSGITVSPMDHQELADALDKLAENIGLRQNFGRNGHKRVHEHFSDDVIIEKLRKKYLEIFNL
ncbi:glycosyltransferase [Maribacter spongiicola]|uniref:glycosyltransferase n=1 Tax=Maribacter spongiicola TaxID=1206753 RepID=UPI003F94F7FF